MIQLRLIFFTALLCGAINSATAMSLFRPKEIPNDGTWSDNSGDSGGSGFTGSPNHRTSYIAPVNGTCKVNCNSSAEVQIDVNARCMCISGSKCFTVDIGHGGLGSETTNGTGTLSANVSGARYQTKPGPGNTNYDNDAINMGIPANSAHGKWIHKARQCGAEGDKTRGGRNKTAGCIGVPCAYWPEVKAAAFKGKRVNVCRGSVYETSRDHCSSKPGYRCNGVKHSQSASPGSGGSRSRPGSGTN